MSTWCVAEARAGRAAVATSALDYRLKSGRGLRRKMRIVDDGGRELPRDGKTFGHCGQGPVDRARLPQSDEALDRDG